MATSFETTKYLCASSCFIGVSSIVLFQMEQYALSFLMGVLCLTSINHWRDYDFGGWRQRVDMAWVNVCGTYGLIEILVHGSEIQQVIFFNMLACVCFFYMISQLEYKHWSIFHMSIHLYASFFIPLLYLI